MSNKEKNKEKRIAEKEKIEAETQRSLAVAAMKQTHKKIEDIEKDRKYSSILSLRKRIVNFSKNVNPQIDALFKPVFGMNPFYDEALRKAFLYNYKVYESIYFDVKKTMEIKEETMKELFPKINPEDPKTGAQMACFLLCLVTQTDHMGIYCERFFT